MSYGMKDEFYEAGSFILRFGEIQDKIIFITDGTVEISVKFNNVEVDVEFLYRGCWIGLYSCLM